MNKQFDELPKNMAQSVTRRGALKQFGLGLACFALTCLFAGLAHAANFYVDASVAVNGEGTAARPYWRITDAVAQARLLRQTGAIPLTQRIIIQVAPGNYVGSKVNSVLNQNPRYEALPILLNVPNLTLSGSTALTLDSGGLPNGVQPGTETLIGTEDHYGSQGKSIVLLSRTTDGMAGNAATVSGFIVAYLNDRDQFASGITIDRVSDFVIRQNLIITGLGIYSSRACGSIEGNLLTGSGSGVVAKGGSRLSPSRYLITRNRSIGHHDGTGILVEASGLTPQLDVGANKLKIESLPESEDRDDPPFTNEAMVTGNDCSDDVQGLRVFIYSPSPKPVNPDLTAEPLLPRVTITAYGNTLNRNLNYGLVVDANNAFRSINRPLTAVVSGQFWNNQLAQNPRGAALFSFTLFRVSLGTDSLKDFKYLQDATFDIADLDGELAGFDYDNPIIDPFDGTVLNNTLRVNGTLISPGTKITPQGP